MNLLDHVHRFARRIGVAPTLFDPLVLAIAAAAAGWIVNGTFGIAEIKLAAAGVVLGLVAANGEGLLDELHRFAESIGLSPKVLDPLAFALAAVVASWITTGTLDTGELRIAAAAVLHGLIGFAAPAGLGVTQREVNYVARRRRNRIDGDPVTTAANTAGEVTARLR